MIIERVGGFRHSVGVLPLLLAAASVAVGWMASVSATASITPLCEQELLAVHGGTKGTCCVSSTKGCGGVPSGCANSNNKCQDANSCPVNGQQIQQNLRGQYPNATCASAKGSMGTVNLQQIVCYNTVTCVQGCTKKTYYYYCNAGNFVAAGPNQTPTQPDNVPCP